ncbi:MAG: TraB/GumN family protein [Flavobacteriales bacterium]|nr:TraB/GumN family protein [Flavobacteriales bacterium]
MRSYPPRLFSLVAACAIVFSIGLHSVHAQIDRTQNALLWRISGNGLAKPSYLFGTMHVSSKIAFDLNRPFFDALRSADVVALEMDPGTWLGEMVAHPLFQLGLASNAQGFNLPVKGFYEDAFNVSLPTRQMLEQALSSSPQVINSLLYRITDQGRDHEESTYLDLFIFQSGRKLGKPVVGLEDFDSVFGLAMGMMDEGEVDEKDRKRRREKLREFTKDGRSTNAILEEAYRNEDLLRIDSLYAVMMPSQKAHDAMLGDRNDGMLEKMMTLMGQRTLFAAVGAAHLPGQRGLIQLLRDRGYTLEPLTADMDPTTTRLRIDLEQRYLPPSFTTYRSNDGVFSIDLPSEFHLMRLGGELSYLATDAVNGTSVMLQRIPTHSGLDGMSTAALMTRLDSLIYAAVPGKIGQRKRMRWPDGSPGFVLSSQTSRGHYLHYRILVTPLEIAILKVSTSHAKAAKDVTRILSSFRFDSRVRQPDPSVELPEHGVAFSMPGYRLLDTRNRFPLGDHSLGWLDLNAHGTGAEGHSHHHLMLATLFDETHLEEDTFELGQLKKRFAERYSLEVLSATHGHHQGRPSLRATLQRKDGDVVHALWTLRGPHFAELAVRGPEPEAEAFFGSFRFLPGLAVQAQPATDQLLYFTTEAETVNRAVVGNDAMANVMRKAFLNERENKGNGHDLRVNDWVYVSASTNDAVHVNFRKEQRYEQFTDTAAYWTARWRQAISNIPGRVEGKRFWSDNGMRYSEGVILDSTTSRGIHVRFVNKAGATWMLETVVDAADGLTPWAELFYNTFTPTDTTFETDLFSDRREVFFADVLGTDSLRNRQAIRSMGIPTFEAVDAPRMIQVLKEVQFRKNDVWSRNAFVQKLGATGAPEAIPFLVERFRAWEDSMDLQLNVLSALASHHTKAGTQAFVNLLFEDTPMPEGHWSINHAFSGLHDSLQLAVPYFPRLFGLLRHNEYKPAVLNLLAAMVNKGLVKSELYAARKVEMLADAQVELKRAVSGGNDYDYDDESLTSRWTTEFDASWTWDAERNDPWEDTYDPAFIGAYTGGVHRYARLLLPWYEEPAVKAWFAKVLASKAHDDVLLTTLLLINAGKTAPTEVIQRYADDPGSRLWLRDRLHAMGKPELFNDALFAQEDVVLGTLLSGRYRQPNDSVSVIEVRHGASRFGAGQVYLVRVKYEGAKEAALHIAGFQPADSTDVNWDMRFVQYEGTISEEKLNEKLDQAMERVAMAGRKRVRIKKDDAFDRWW